MYDIDWLGENEPLPKKKRHRRTKAEMVAARAAEKIKPKYHDQVRFAKQGRKGGKKQAAGCKQGRGWNTPESKLKAAATMNASKWRRRAPNTGSPSMQSSSGTADCTVYSGEGRIYPKFLREDWDS